MTILAERSAFRFDVRTIETKAAEGGGQVGIVTGYASVFGNVDDGYDVVNRGAFTKTLSENGGVMPVLLCHDDDDLPVGVTSSAAEDDYGLLVTMELNLDTQRGREAFALVKQGALRGLSIGYRAVKEAWNGIVRQLLEVQLYEVSLVVFGMNELATITGTKAARIAAAISVAERDQKAGRVLSEASRTLLGQAIESLTALLASSEPADATPASGGAADSGKAAANNEPAIATRLLAEFKNHTSKES